MAIAFVNSNITPYAVGTTLGKTALIPSGTTAGNLIVAGFMGGVSGTCATPAGWSPVTNGSGVAGTSTAQLFYRIAQSGDAGATTTFTQTTGTRVIIIMGVYSGVDQTTPIPQCIKTNETTATVTHDAGDITLTNAAWTQRWLFLKDGGTASTGITEVATNVMRQTQPGNVFSSTFQQSLSMSDPGTDKAPGTHGGNWVVAPAGATSATAAAFVLELTPQSSTVTVRPTSDITTTGLTIVPTGTAFSVLADDDPATYVEVPATGQKVLEVKFGTFSAAPNTITVKYLTAGGAATNSLNVKLMQGSTVIADFPTDTSVPTTETVKVFTLSSPQKSAITNLTDLRVRITETVT